MPPNWVPLPPASSLALLFGRSAELEKVDCYKLGDPTRVCDAATVEAAWKIVQAAATLALAASLALCYARCTWW